jgi:hypothetical protein
MRHVVSVRPQLVFRVPKTNRLDSGFLTGALRLRVVRLAVGPYTTDDQDILSAMFLFRYCLADVGLV